MNRGQGIRGIHRGYNTRYNGYVGAQPVSKKGETEPTKLLGYKANHFMGIVYHINDPYFHLVLVDHEVY